MLCDLCGSRKAVIFVQQVTASGKKEIHICEQCAAEQGVDSSSENIGINLQNLVNGFAPERKVCSVCGRSIDDIRKTGNVGCPECYAAFQSEIRSLLQKSGAEFPYTGSMPKKLAYFRSILTDRIAIQTKLQASIENEDYEKAAKYRDFLRALETPAVTGADDFSAEAFHE